MTPDQRNLIDHTLLAVATELAARARDVMPQLQTSVARLSLAELRASPLGRNLALLAHVVDGEPSVPRSRVSAAISHVQTFLFSPLFASDRGAAAVGVSAALLETLAEQLLNAARVRVLDVSTAVLVTDAARRAGIPRSYLNHLIERGDIHVIDVGGRKMISGEEYDRLTELWNRDRPRESAGNGPARGVGEAKAGTVEATREDASEG